MKTLITFICTMFMLACASNTPTVATVPNGQTVTIVDTSGPPWDSLSAEDRALYTDNYACVEATDAMDSMMGWPTVVEAEEVSPGTFVYVVQSPSGLIGYIQYREGGTRVVEMGMLVISGETSVLFIDYEVLRAFHTGAASPDDENALSLATGQYFCVYM